MIAIPFLSSCDLEQTQEQQLDALSGRDQAKQLYAFVDENMDAISSYKSTQKLSATLIAYEIPVSVESTSEISYYKDGENTIIYNVSSYTTEAEDVKESRTAESGFIGGKMFSKYEDDSKTSALYSRISADEYLEYLEEKGVDIFGEISGALDVTVEKSEEGEWSASCSAFLDDSLSVFNELLGDTSGMIGEDIRLRDVTITLLTDNNLRAKKIGISYEYQYTGTDDSVTLPSVDLEMTFSELNTLQAPTISLEDYTRVNDIRDIETVDNAIKAYKNSLSGKFMLESKVVTSAGLNKSTTSNENEIVFSRRNEGGKLTISVEGSQVLSDGTNLTQEMRYANKYFRTRIYYNSNLLQSDSSKCTDAEARLILENWMDQGAFTPSNIKNVQERLNEENAYTFTLLEIDASAIFAGLSKIPEYELTEAKITVYLDRGKLSKYIYEATIEFNYLGENYGAEIFTEANYEFREDIIE